VTVTTAKKSKATPKPMRISPAGVMSPFGDVSLITHNLVDLLKLSSRPLKNRVILA
jgi:hypothetical protein